MYFHKEDGDKKAKIRIESYRMAAELYPTVKKIIQQFDGKVLNCRLEKALREATGKHIVVSKRYRWLEIEHYPGGGYESRILAQVELAKLLDGKRIPAELLNESLLERRIDYLKRAAELEREMMNAENYYNQFQYYIGQIEKLNRSINSDISNIYYLNYRVQNY